MNHIDEVPLAEKLLDMSPLSWWESISRIQNPSYLAFFELVKHMDAKCYNLITSYEKEIIYRTGIGEVYNSNISKCKILFSALKSNHNDSSSFSV